MNEETLTIEDFIRLLKSHIKTNHYKYSDSFESVIKDLIEQISDVAEEKGYRNGYDAGYEAGQSDKKQEIIENLRTML
jgi:flagellar biosynthesis/type III secretory pathway protein FliH